MRWKSIQRSIIGVLLLLNLVLGTVRMGIVHFERREEKEALVSALALCKLRGITASDVDFSVLEPDYPYYLLGSSVREEYPVISENEKKVMLSLSQAVTAVSKNLSEQYPDISFSLTEMEQTEAGWALVYCRSEGEILHLEDRAFARISFSGALTIRFEFWEVTGEEKQSASFDSGTMLAQALLRLEKQEIVPVSLDSVYIAYRTEKEDRIAYSVPYAVFRFTLENGSSYEVFIRTGER